MRSPERRKSGWAFAGGLAIVAIAAAVIANLNDIRRYIRIMRM